MTVAPKKRGRPGRPKLNPKAPPKGIAAEKIRALARGKKISKLSDAVTEKTKYSRRDDVGLNVRIKLLEYLANPQNPFLNRTELATKVLNYKTVTALYYHITSAEIKDIEIEAMEMRRTAYITRLSKVDDALFDKAYEGDVNAIKLVYQRFEGWTEKKDYNVQQGINVNIVRFGDVEINGCSKDDKPSE